MWQVAWAHPKFGGILASCSFDHRVIIWKELEQGNWQQVRAGPTSCALSPARPLVPPEQGTRHCNCARLAYMALHSLELNLQGLQ